MLFGQFGSENATLRPNDRSRKQLAEVKFGANGKDVASLYYFVGSIYAYKNAYLRLREDGREWTLHARSSRKGR